MTYLKKTAIIEHEFKIEIEKKPTLINSKFRTAITLISLGKFYFSLDYTHIKKLTFIRNLINSLWKIKNYKKSRSIVNKLNVGQ